MFIRNIKNRPLGLIAILLVSFFSPLLFVKEAHAYNVTGGFVDAATYTITELSFTIEDYNENRIHQNNTRKLSSADTPEAGLERLNARIATALPITLKDSDITDSTNDLDSADGVLGCNNDGIKLERKDNDWRLTDLNISADGSCVDILSDKNLLFHNGDPAEAFIVFVMTDENTIVMVDEKGTGRYGNFVREDPVGYPNTFYSDKGGESITLATITNNGGVSDVTMTDDLKLDLEGNEPDGPWGYLRGADIKVALLNTDGTPSVNAPDATGGVGDTIDKSCEGTDFAFNFIMCPLLYMGDEAIGWLDDRIISLLRVEDAYYNDPAVRAAWTNIRDISFILLIPTMLLMVIGTALGFQFLDAYTVKRALPRMLAAIIFIALSYDICVFLIEITNLVGQGIAGIIAAPWDGLSNLTMRDIFDPGPGTAAITIGGPILLYFLVRSGTVPTGEGSAVSGAIGAIRSVAFVVIGMAVLIVALTLLVIFSLLAFREIAIIFLALISPLAILAWIFPGNDKPWKLWWGAFSKLLLLFPLIMALVTTGRAFAVVVGDAGGDPVVSTLIKLVAVVGPYFFIPAAFKYAGGVFANIAGIVNDRSKGIFDRSKKFRAERAKKNFKDYQEGRRYKGDSERARRLNERGRRFHARKQAYEEGGWRGALNDTQVDIIEQSHDNASAKKGAEHEAFTDISGDDAKNWAAFYTTREEIERELINRDPGRFANDANAREQAVEQILRAQRVFGNNEAFQRARLDAQGPTGTAYIDENGNFNADLALEDINRVYGEDRSGAGRALAKMRSTLVQSGQVAGQAGYGTWASQMESQYRDSADQTLTAAQRQANSQLRHDTIMDDAIDSSNPGSAVYGKPSSAAAFGAAHARRIQAIANGIANGTHTQDDLDAATAAAAGLLDAMGQASPQNASAFANELMGVTIQGSGQLQIAGEPMQPGTGPTLPGMYGPDRSVREMIDDRMSNEEYKNRRRDYGANASQQAAAWQQSQQQPGAAGLPPQGGQQPPGGIGG